jgi:thiamine-phosphate pyrophosphorylase
VNAALEGIYAIVDAATTPDAESYLDALLRGGIRLVQYRAKNGVERALVRALHVRTRAAGALLIVNDDVEAALEADGLHAGQEDLEALRCAGVTPVRLRALLANKLLGVSCGVADEAVRASAGGADYIGTGPFKTTATKADAGAAIGASGLTSVCRATALPVAAIGGIELDDLPAVAAAGARMAAVVSALARAPDPAERARAFVAAWGRARA